jgi:hypothetical protein
MANKHVEAILIALAELKTTLKWHSVAIYGLYAFLGSVAVVLLRK